MIGFVIAAEPDPDEKRATMMRLDTVEHAIEEIRAGRPVIVVDDEDRENEGDIVFAASAATTALMAFTVRHSSGVICVPMNGDALDRLDIPLMVADNKDAMGTAFTVSVDATAGVTTGISAADRARTARVLADPTSVAADVRRPGHVFALRARPGGVLERRGHTEATVDLVTLAGLAPVGVLVELTNDDGTMKRGSDLRQFADRHDIPLISIESLVRFRMRTETWIRRGSLTRMPTCHGVFDAVGYASDIDGTEHLAILCGEVGDRSAVPMIVHSECALGDLFGSLSCSCSSSLNAALARIAADGIGVVVYIRRGVGTHDCAAPVANLGMDAISVDSDTLQAQRSADIAAHIVRDLGLKSVVPASGTISAEMYTEFLARGVEIADDRVMDLCGRTSLARTSDGCALL